MSERAANAHFANQLAAAVVFRAVRDAQAADLQRAEEARRWLLSDHAGDLLDCLSIPRDRVVSWLDGLEPLPCEQLTLW